MASIATVDFFSVERGVDDGPSFLEALDGSMKLPPADRAMHDFHADPYRMQTQSRVAGRPYFEGDFVRIRMNEAPPIVRINGDWTEIPLEDDQGIGEESAWWADPAREIIAIQRSRFVSIKALASYFSSVTRNQQIFSFLPILRKKAYGRLLKMSEVRSVSVRVAAPNPTLVKEAGYGPTAATKIIGDLAIAGAMEIEVKGSVKGHHRLSAAAVQRLINGLMESGPLSSAKVRGRMGDDDPIEEYDILKDRLRYRVDVGAVRGPSRVVPYRTRRDAIRKAISLSESDLASVVRS